MPVKNPKVLLGVSAEAISNKASIGLLVLAFGGKVGRLISVVNQAMIVQKLPTASFRDL